MASQSKIDTDAGRSNIDLAFEHHESGSYSEAFSYALKALQEDGEVGVLNLIAQMYGLGQFVKKSDEKKRALYHQAAAMGDLCANYNLGIIYHFGQNVKKNHSVAFYYYYKAAQGGYSKAMNDMGLAYQYGHGVKPDFHKAEYWFMKGTEIGDVYAFTNLGWLYLKKQPKPDYTKAVHWFRRAVNEGDEDARGPLNYVIDILVGDLIGNEECTCPKCTKRATRAKATTEDDDWDCEGKYEVNHYESNDEEKSCSNDRDCDQLRVEEDQEEECSICLSTLLEDEACTIDETCGHRFHNDCISHWISKCVDRKQSVTCPMCRRIVTKSVMVK